MPTSQVNSLIKAAQISQTDVQMKGAANIPDFKFENATVVANWNGYVKKKNNNFISSSIKFFYNIDLLIFLFSILKNINKIKKIEILNLLPMLLLKLVVCMVVHTIKLVSILNLIRNF